MKYNLSKANAIFIAISFVIIVVGFSLMIGEPSGATEYNPDIFSFRRVTLGPMISLFGFALTIVAILWGGKKQNNSLDNQQDCPSSNKQE